MKKLIFLALPLFIAACGGGGDSSSSSTPAPTLNLNAAYVDYIKTGNTTTSTISGYCSGTSVVTNSAATLGKNGAGVAAYIVNNTEKDTISASSPTVCSTKIYNSNEGGQVYQNYYDTTNLLPISDGYSPKYYVYGSQQAAPASVTAGSAGSFYTYQDYKGGASPVTSAIVTYAVSADTASTLLVTVTETSTLISSGAPYFSNTTIYRLNANNTLTKISNKLQAYNAATGFGDITTTETVVR